jgi:hypothetical protein
MYSNRRYAWTPVLALAGVVVVACAATRITSSWLDESYTAGPLKRVLVVGISAKESVRKTFENTFVAEMRAAGVEAAASYPLLPDIKEGDAEAIRSAARSLSVDRVLVTRLVAVEEKEVFNPPVTAPVPQDYYYSYGWYYSTVFDSANEAGYYSSREFVKLESNLYDTDTEGLIWSAATETIDPEDIAAAARELFQVLVKDMKAKGLIQ